MRRRKLIEDQQKASSGHEGDTASDEESSAEPEGSPQSTATQSTATQTKPADLGPEFKDVGRNDTCPCGSGKKFKKCHGR